MTRRGVGGALRLFIVDYFPKAKRLEVDDAFDAAYEEHKWAKDMNSNVQKLFKKACGGKKKEVDVEAWTACCKEWKAVGSNLSILKCRLFFVEISESEIDEETGLPKWRTLINLSNIAIDAEDEEEEALKAEAKIQRAIEKKAAAEAEAAAAAAAAAAAEGGEEEAPAAAPSLASTKSMKSMKSVKKKNDGELTVEDVEAPDTMELPEFKKGIAKLAWALCKGKTVEEKLTAFAAKHLQI